MLTPSGVIRSLLATVIVLMTTGLQSQDSIEFVQTWTSTDGRTFDGVLTGYDPIEKQLLFEGENGEQLRTSIERLDSVSRLMALNSPVFMESLTSAFKSGQWEPNYQFDRIPTKEWIILPGSWLLHNAIFIFIFYFIFRISARWITGDEDGHLSGYVKFVVMNIIGSILFLVPTIWAYIELFKQGEKGLVKFGLLLTSSYLVLFFFYAVSIWVLKAHYVTSVFRAFLITLVFGILGFIGTFVISLAITFLPFAFGIKAFTPLFSWTNARIENWILLPLDLI